MRQVKGPLYRCKGEDIAILRHIPKLEQNDSKDGDIQFLVEGYNCRYPEKAFEVIIQKAKVMISQRVIPVIDPDGVAILSTDYTCERVPPFNQLPFNKSVQSGDLVLRLDRHLQELYIEGSTIDCHRQFIYLVTRSPTESIDA